MLRGVALAVFLLALPASAQTGFPPITSRDYALDLHVATVIGSTRLVGMGGANIALVEQASGVGVNPAAPAVRAETANDTWEWDAGLSWLNPDLGDDFDNNGVSDGGAGTFLVTGALAFQINRGGIGVELTLLSRDLPDVAETAFADTWILRAAVARSFADDQLTFGLGARSAERIWKSAPRAPRPKVS